MNRLVKVMHNLLNHLDSLIGPPTCNRGSAHRQPPADEEEEVAAHQAIHQGTKGCSSRPMNGPVNGTAAAPGGQRTTRALPHELPIEITMLDKPSDWNRAIH